MADNSQLHFTNIAQPYIPIYKAAPPTLRNTSPTPHHSVYGASLKFKMADNSQLHFTNIAQPYIPIYTAAPPTLRNTHIFLYFFRKTNFQNFLGHFSGAPGAFAPHFRIPLLPLHDLKFFPKFLPPFFMAILRRSRRFALLLHLYGGTSQHTLSYTFSKNQIFKIFWSLSRGPRGFCPPFSNSPTPAT